MINLPNDLGYPKKWVANIFLLDGIPVAELGKAKGAINFSFWYASTISTDCSAFLMENWGDQVLLFEGYRRIDDSPYWIK